MRLKQLALDISCCGTTAAGGHFFLQLKLLKGAFSPFSCFFATSLLVPAQVFVRLYYEPDLLGRMVVIKEGLWW